MTTEFIRLSIDSMIEYVLFNSSMDRALDTIRQVADRYAIDLCGTRNGDDEDTEDNNEASNEVINEKVKEKVEEKDDEYDVLDKELNDINKVEQMMSRIMDED